MRFSLKNLLLGTAAMLCAGAAAHASTITQTVQFGPAVTDYNSSLGTPAVFSYFNSNLGTLNSITFSSTYQFVSQIVLTDVSISSASGSVATQSAAQFGASDSAVTTALNHAVNNLNSPVDGTGVTFGSRTLSPLAYDIYGNRSAYTLSTGTSNTYQSSGSGSTGPFTDTTAADLSAFFKPGGGSYSVLLSTLTGLLVNSTGGNVSASSLTTASGSLTVSYNYTAAAAPPVSVTPEPSSLVLLGTGVLGLAGIARRRFV